MKNRVTLRALLEELERLARHEEGEASKLRATGPAADEVELAQREGYARFLRFARKEMAAEKARLEQRYADAVDLLAVVRDGKVSRRFPTDVGEVAKSRELRWRLSHLLTDFAPPVQAVWDLIAEAEPKGRPGRSPEHARRLVKDTIYRSHQRLEAISILLNKHVRQQPWFWATRGRPAVGEARRRRLATAFKTILEQADAIVPQRRQVAEARKHRGRATDALRVATEVAALLDGAFRQALEEHGRHRTREPEAALAAAKAAFYREGARSDRRRLLALAELRAVRGRP